MITGSTEEMGNWETSMPMKKVSEAIPFFINKYGQKLKPHDFTQKFQNNFSDNKSTIQYKFSSSIEDF